MCLRKPFVFMVANSWPYNGYFKRPCVRSLLETLWEEEKIFSSMLWILSRTKIIILVNFILMSADAFNLDQVKILSFGKGFNSFPHNPDNDPEEEGFWKHFGKKEKMLVTNIFSFSQNIFYHSKTSFKFFCHIYFLVCRCFEFGLV